MRGLRGATARRSVGGAATARSAARRPLLAPTGRPAAAAAAARPSSGCSPSPARRGRPSPYKTRVVAAASSPGGGQSQSAPTPLNGGEMSAAPKTALDWSKAPSKKSQERVRRPENTDGSYWVDTNCINCAVCRKMAPSVFGKANGQSAVLRAPQGDAERLEFYQALLSCPTFSIHTDGKPDPALLRAARDSFPLPAFPGSKKVGFMGFTDIKAIATSSYLLRRGDDDGGGGANADSKKGNKNQGNVLFDAPRFAGPVADALVRECGPDGPAFFVLSHRDDIGEHGRWAERFPKMKRVVHEREAQAVESLRDCEVILTGEGPWRLPDGGEDVLLVLTPGHTSGSITLLFAPEQVALTGDHLDAAPPPAEFGVVPPPPPVPGQKQDLHVFRDYCWDSIDKQLASVAKLAGRGGIRRVLPGHGSPALFESAEEFDAAVERLLVAELPGGAPEAEKLLKEAREALAKEPAPVVPGVVVGVSPAAAVGR